MAKKQKIVELTLFYPNNQTYSWRVGDNGVVSIDHILNDRHAPPYNETMIVNAEKDGKTSTLSFRTAEAYGVGVTLG